MIRRLAWAALVLVLAGGALAVWKGPDLIVSTARTVLGDAGLPEIDFKIGRITLNDVTLEGIRVAGGALEIPRLSAVFTWRELIEGKIGALSIDGMTLTATYSDAGISFGDLDRFLVRQPGPAHAPAANPVAVWPFRQLSLRNAIIDVVERDATRLRLVLDGTVSRGPDGGLEIGPGTVRADADNVVITASVSARAAPDGLFAASLQLLSGHADFQNIRTEARAGTLDLQVLLTDPSSLQATGALSVAMAALPFGLDPTADLSLTYRDGFLLADLAAMDAEAGLSASFQTTVNLSAPPAAQTVTLDFLLEAADAAALPADALPIPLSGGRATLSGTVGAPVAHLQKGLAAQTLADLAAAVPGSRFKLSAIDVETPLLPVRLSFSSDLAVEPGADGGLVLDIPTGMLIEIDGADETGWAALLGPLGNEAQRSAPLRIDLSGTGVPVLRATVGPDALEAHLSAILAADGAGLPHIDGSFLGSVRFGLSDASLSASVERITVSVHTAGASHASLPTVSLYASGAGDGKRAAGALAVSARADTVSLGDVTLSNAGLSLPASWTMEEGTFRLAAVDCGTVRFDMLALPAARLQAPSADFCLQPAEIEISPLEPAQAAEPFDIRAGVTLTHTSGPLLANLPGGQRAKLAPGGVLKIAGGGTRDTVRHFDLALELGAALLPTIPAEVTSVTLTAKQQAESAETALSLRAVVEDAQRPVRVAPLKVSATADIGAEGDIEGNGRLTVGDDLLAVEFDLEHALPAGTGRATARVLPFRFTAQDQRLSRALPFLQDRLSRASGNFLAAVSADWTRARLCAQADGLLRRFNATLAGGAAVPLSGTVGAGQIGLGGRLCRSDGGLTDQGGQIMIEEGVLVTDPVALQSVNTVIDLSGLVPLRTEPAQLLSIGVADIGYPLTDGLARVTVGPDETITLNDLSFRWAGGTVTLPETVFSSQAMPDLLPFSFDGIRVDKLTQLMPRAGLSGEGILSGAVPVVFEEDGPAVRGGRLHSSDGIIRYQPIREDGAPLTEVDAALSNLHYSDLSLDISGGLRGGAAIALHVEGKNPDYYDGVPVVLDLSLTGPLGTMMNDGLAAYRVPAQIVERLQRFGQY